MQEVNYDVFFIAPAISLQKNMLWAIRIILVPAWGFFTYVVSLTCQKSLNQAKMLLQKFWSLKEEQHTPFFTTVLPCKEKRCFQILQVFNIPGKRYLPFQRKRIFVRCNGKLRLRLHTYEGEWFSKSQLDASYGICALYEGSSCSQQENSIFLEKTLSAYGDIPASIAEGAFLLR